MRITVLSRPAVVQHPVQLLIDDRPPLARWRRPEEQHGRRAERSGQMGDSGITA
jgi:hypothetical protein